MEKAFCVTIFPCCSVFSSFSVYKSAFHGGAQRTKKSKF